MSNFYRALLGLGVQAISQSEHLLLAHGRPWLRLQVAPDSHVLCRPDQSCITRFLLAHRADLSCRLAHALGLDLSTRAAPIWSVKLFT